MLDVCSLCCFSTFVLEVQLLVALLLLLVEVELFHLLAKLLLYSKSLFLVLFLLLFLVVLDVFVRIIEVLLSELKDVEVVDLPLFDVQFNDAVVTKMSLQNW